MRVSEIFPSARGNAAKQLVELGQRHDELRVESRDLQAQTAATSAEQDQTAGELREAEGRQRAFGDAAPRIKEAKARLAKLEAAGAERSAEARIVHDASEQVEAAIRDHARRHARALWGEMGKDNTGVAERLTQAVEAVVVASHDYTQAGIRATELMRLIDVEQLRKSRVPELPSEIASLTKAARIAAGDIRVPIPESPGQGPVVRLAEQPAQAVSA